MFLTVTSSSCVFSSPFSALLLDGFCSLGKTLSALTQLFGLSVCVCRYSLSKMVTMTTAVASVTTAVGLVLSLEADLTWTPG